MRSGRSGVMDEKWQNVACPLCGNSMIQMGGILGLPVEGYQCRRWDCVGIDLSIEDLCDAENYRVIVDEALGRKCRVEEMWARNGAVEERALGMSWCWDCR